MQVDFQYSIKDQVIIPSGLPGEIEGMWIGKYGDKQVCVRFDNKETGASITQYFDENQVKPVA